MAADGHPFWTTELDELRAEQRRILRHIPTWVINHYRAYDTSIESVRGDDRPYAEVVLRRAIRDEVLTDEVAAVLLERMERHSDSELMYELSKALDGDDVFTHRAYQSHREHRLANLQDQEIVWLKRLIVVLMVADELADDDYADWRLTEDDDD